jgi:DNA-binding IclR family transcriptional regulator
MSEERHERVINALAALTEGHEEGTTSREIGQRLGEHSSDVTRELLSAERIGTAWRSGRTRSTRWHLG